MSSYKRDTKSIYLVLAFSFAIIAALGPYISNKITEQSLKDQAEITAVQWADYLTRSTPEIDKILEGKMVGAHSYHMLSVDNQGKDGVYITKLLDTNLVPMYSSVNHEHKHHGHSDSTAQHTEHSMHSSQAVPQMLKILSQSALATSINSLENGEKELLLGLLNGNGADKPESYSEAIIPIKLDGRLAGYFYLEINHSEKYAKLKSSLNFMAYSLLALSLFALLLPAVMIFYKLSYANKEVSSKLSHAEEHDGLTGLLNREAFRNMLSPSLALGQKSVLFFIDLDGFKSINDQFGHDIGDGLLQTVAKRLRSAAGDDALLCRHGGDEFIVSVPIHKTVDIQELGNRFQTVLSDTMFVKGHNFTTGASIGTAVAQKDASDIDELVRVADIAMYVAKDLGKGQTVAFEASMEEVRKKRLKLEKLLRTALRNESFCLHYQPIYMNGSSTLKGFEALLRLKDKEGNLISPVEFIPVIEEMGIMNEVGEWVLTTACKEASSWAQDLIISVNLSTTQFVDGSLIPVVNSVLNKTNLPSQRLQLEVTESVLIEDADLVLQQLLELREMGITLSLDDFGTGYSSLNYVWRYPFDNLKIDRAFVEKLNTGDQKANSILKTIIDMSSTLGLTTTAEGIETDGQREYLADSNCDNLQGFLLGRPVPREELPSIILNSLQNDGIVYKDSQSDANIAKRAI